MDASEPLTRLELARVFEHLAALLRTDGQSAEPLRSGLDLGGASSDPLLLLAAEDVARLFGVSKSWVYREHRAGRLPGKKIGPQQLRFRRSDVELWLESQSALELDETSGLR